VLTVDLLSHISLWWTLVFVIGGFLLAWESAAPLRTPLESKLRHVSVNLVIFGVNALGLRLAAGGTLLLWSSRIEDQAWGLLNQLQLNPVSNIAVSVILLDLIYYGIHRLNHRVPFFWRFHRAHHSDLDVDVTTGLRFHLGEVLISTGIKVVSVLALGISPLGVLISEMALLMSAQFQHSNIPLPATIERTLRLGVVTPPMHIVHHSVRLTEQNSNYGTMLSWWDRLFGTYVTTVPQGTLTLGLDEYRRDLGVIEFYRIPLDPPARASAE
jgi:sterol desaturase/sphingolipid hydroxylase (fatty acid hydroxylase superfamily)